MIETRNWYSTKGLRGKQSRNCSPSKTGPKTRHLGENRFSILMGEIFSGDFSHKCLAKPEELLFFEEMFLQKFLFMWGYWFPFFFSFSFHIVCFSVCVFCVDSKAISFSPESSSVCGRLACQ